MRRRRRRPVPDYIRSDVISRLHRRPDDVLSCHNSLHALLDRNHVCFASLDLPWYSVCLLTNPTCAVAQKSTEARLHRTRWRPCKSAAALHRDPRYRRHSLSAFSSKVNGSRVSLVSVMGTKVLNLDHVPGRRAWKARHWRCTVSFVFHSMSFWWVCFVQPRPMQLMMDDPRSGYARPPAVCQRLPHGTNMPHSEKLDPESPR